MRERLPATMLAYSASSYRHVHVLPAQSGIARDAYALPSPSPERLECFLVCNFLHSVRLAASVVNVYPIPAILESGNLDL